jgi:hypothetical protein
MIATQSSGPNTRCSGDLYVQEEKEHVAILNFKLANGYHYTLFVCSAMHYILDLQNMHIPQIFWPYFAYSAYYTIYT